MLKADKQKDHLINLIKNHTEYAIGALLKIYSFQTTDEQYSGSTQHDNAMGFNAVDAGFMSSMAKQFLKKGSLSEKQIPYVKRTMLKYIMQLEQVGFEPVNLSPIKTEAILPTIKTATLEKNNIVIKFQFPKGDPQFFEMVSKVKTLPGRRFVKTPEAGWVCPLSIEAAEKLTEWKFDISSDLQEWYRKITVKPEINHNLEIPGLKRDLYPFQKEGAAFIENRNGRALIADSMGLGKTAQSLAYLQLHPELRPALIIVPASLKLNWAKEINIWMSNTKENADVQICSGSPNKTSGNPLHGNIVIINYDILGKWEERIQEYNFKVVILDEVHMVKNNKAQRTKAVIKICKKIKHVIALSGTPITNRPIEFYNSIKIIEPGLFPSRWKFAHEYCGAKHNGFGWDFNGATNTTKLHKLLTNTIMIRRKKEDVLKDLPAKTRSIVPLKIDNYKEYKYAESNIISWIKENEGKEKAEKASQAEVLVSFEKLKQLAINGKIKQCINWIENFLESDQKLIIFCTHKKTIQLLTEHFGDIAVKLDGSTSLRERQFVVDKFQGNPDIKLFIGNVKAAGVGITLTAASNVCFLEFPWSSGEVLQAEDRPHRIGQNASSVNIWFLLASQTIEEDIVKLLEKKANILDQILDGKAIEENSTFKELIDVLKNT